MAPFAEGLVTHCYFYLAQARARNNSSFGSQYFEMIKLASSPYNSFENCNFETCAYTSKSAVFVGCYLVCKKCFSRLLEVFQSIFYGELRLLTPALL